MGFSNSGDLQTLEGKVEFPASARAAPTSQGRILGTPKADSMPKATP